MIHSFDFIADIMILGLYPEIAISKYEYWSSLAPLPLEVVISAGQKSMEESYNQGKKYAKRILTDVILTCFA